MSTGEVVQLGPRKFGLSAVMEQIPHVLAEELGLLRPKEEFDALTVQECLAHQQKIAQRLGELTTQLWSDSDTRFLVVSGDTVYASSRPFAQFDQVGFEQTMPHLSTIIVPQAPQLPQPQIVSCPDLGPSADVAAATY